MINRFLAKMQSPGHGRSCLQALKKSTGSGLHDPVGLLCEVKNRPMMGGSAIVLATAPRDASQWSAA
jgi:hypothetical protein